MNTTMERKINFVDWVLEDFIDLDVLKDIVTGGCASGSYMPAVAYSKATKTMAQHGDEVLSYIEEHTGYSTPQIFHIVTREGDSWAGVACAVLSFAVEIWAGNELNRMGIYI